MTILNDAQIDESFAQLKEELSRVCIALYIRRMVYGSGGNVSARWRDIILITPTGQMLGDITPDSLCLLDLDETPLTNDRPTSKWCLHLAVYQQNPQLSAIVCSMFFQALPTEVASTRLRALKLNGTLAIFS